MRSYGQAQTGGLATQALHTIPLPQKGPSSSKLTVQEPLHSVKPEEQMHLLAEQYLSPVQDVPHVPQFELSAFRSC